MYETWGIAADGVLYLWNMSREQAIEYVRKDNSFYVVKVPVVSTDHPPRESSIAWTKKGGIGIGGRYKKRKNHGNSCAIETMV